MPDLSSNAAQLINHRMNGTLEAFVRTGRRKGRSWRELTLDLRDTTGVTITHETLRIWFADLPGKAAS